MKSLNEAFTVFFYFIASLLLLMLVTLMVINNDKEIKDTNIENTKNHDTQKYNYSILKFINSGKEVDILKMFPDINTLSEYYRDIFEIKNNNIIFCRTEETDFSSKTSKKMLKNLSRVNSYKDKVSTMIKIQPITEIAFSIANKRYYNSISNKMSPGIIDYVTMKTFYPSLIFKNIKHNNSSVITDTTSYVIFVVFGICSIDKNEKLLTFDQIKYKLIDRYGPPTSYGHTIYPYNWQIRKYQERKELLWEDSKVLLVYSIINYNRQYCREARKTSFFARYKQSKYHNSKCLYLYLENKSNFRNEIYKQKYDIFESEQLILLKRRILTMEELKAQKAKAASKIKF